MPAVSIVVPVYRVESYLEQCVDSLRSQTLRNIEILLVDDGSPDWCGAICDAYAERDPRIRVIHQENAGLSAARNAGIEAASGEYIMFVDSDDWAEPDYCRIPYEIAKTHGADLVIFQYYVVKRNRRTQADCRNLPEGIVTEEMGLYRSWLRYWMEPAWNKLFHRKLFRDLRFPEGRCHEDTGIVHRLIHAADRIWYDRTFLYNYRFGRKGSITTDRTRTASDDRFEMYMQKVSDLEQWGFREEAQCHRENAYYAYLLSRTAEAEHYRECADFFVSPGVIPARYSVKSKWMLMLFRHARPLFALACMAARRRIK